MHLTIQIVSLSFARPLHALVLLKYIPMRYIACVHLAIFPKLCRFLAIKDTLSIQLYNIFKVSNI